MGSRTLLSSHCVGHSEEVPACEGVREGGALDGWWGVEADSVEGFGEGGGGRGRSLAWGVRTSWGVGGLWCLLSVVECCDGKEEGGRGRGGRGS